MTALPFLENIMEQVTVKLTGQAITARYGTLNTGAVLKTDAEFAKHLVEDCGVAQYCTPPTGNDDEAVAAQQAKLQKESDEAAELKRQQEADDAAQAKLQKDAEAAQAEEAEAARLAEVAAQEKAAVELKATSTKGNGKK